MFALLLGCVLAGLALVKLVTLVAWPERRTPCWERSLDRLVDPMEWHPGDRHRREKNEEVPLSVLLGR